MTWHRTPDSSRPESPAPASAASLSAPSSRTRSTGCLTITTITKPLLGIIHLVFYILFYIFGGQRQSFWIFIFNSYRYSTGIEVNEVQIYKQNFAWGFVCGFVGWKWACSLDALELY
jgi:hypothetical protein